MELNKKKRILLIIALLFLSLALTHSFLQIYLFGVQSETLESISGFSIGKTDLGEEITLQYRSAPVISQIVVVGEWAILFLFMLFSFAISKMHSAREKVIHIPKQKEKNKTDLDVLYDILKREKKVSLGTIIKSFGIDRNTALEWCRTLESGNLASVEYPRFGQPQIKIRE